MDAPHAHDAPRTADASQVDAMDAPHAHDAPHTVDASQVDAGVPQDAPMSGDAAPPPCVTPVLGGPCSNPSFGAPGTALCPADGGAPADPANPCSAGFIWSCNGTSDSWYQEEIQCYASDGTTVITTPCPAGELLFVDDVAGDPCEGPGAVGEVVLAPPGRICPRLRAASTRPTLSACRSPPAAKGGSRASVRSRSAARNIAAEEASSRGCPARTCPARSWIVSAARREGRSGNRWEVPELGEAHDVSYVVREGATSS
jgi:hypothetical protein